MHLEPIIGAKIVGSRILNFDLSRSQGSNLALFGPILPFPDGAVFVSRQYFHILLVLNTAMSMQNLRVTTQKVKVTAVTI